MSEELTDEEKQSILVALVGGSESGEIDPAALDAAEEWAENTKSQYELLQEVIAGRLDMRIGDDGEPEFRLNLDGIHAMYGDDMIVVYTGNTND